MQLLKKNLSNDIDTPSREQFDPFLRSINYNLSDFVCVFEKSEFEPFVSKLEKDYTDGKFNKSYIDDLDLLLEHMYARVYWEKELVDQDISTLIRELDEADMKRNFRYRLGDLWGDNLDDNEWFGLLNDLNNAAAKGTLLQSDVDVIIMYLDEAYIHRNTWRLKKIHLRALIRDLNDAYKKTSHDKNSFFIKNEYIVRYLRPLRKGRRSHRTKFFKRISRFFVKVIHFHQVYSLFLRQPV